MRYSRNNVASLSLEEFRTRSSNDRFETDRWIKRSVAVSDQQDSFTFYYIMHFCILIVFFKRLSRSCKIFEFVTEVCEVCELTTMNFVKRYSESDILIGPEI